MTTSKIREDSLVKYSNRSAGEEVKKSQMEWKLLKNSLLNSVKILQVANKKDITLSHGIYHDRKINLNKPVKCVLYLSDKQEYLVITEGLIGIFDGPGRLKRVRPLQYDFSQILFASDVKRIIGWSIGNPHIYVMNSELRVLSVSKAPYNIYLVVYNELVNEVVTTGVGCITTWVFQHAAAYMVQHKNGTTKILKDDKFTNIVLERTANKMQNCFCSLDCGVAVFRAQEGSFIVYKKELHEREITALAFYNTLKYLATGCKDGCIKIWDNTWHIVVVFVGHSSRITSMDILHENSNLMSTSTDYTIRAWSLETLDEVDRVATDTVAVHLCTKKKSTIFYTYADRHIDLWNIEHLQEVFMIVGTKVTAIKMTTHPVYPLRAVVISNDLYVHIMIPWSGAVITTLVIDCKPNLHVVDTAYAIAEDTLFTLMNDGCILKWNTATNPCIKDESWSWQSTTGLCTCLLLYEFIVKFVKNEEMTSLQRVLTTENIRDKTLMTAHKNTNRTILMAGQQNGKICTFNWKTGETDSIVQGHDKSEVLCMIPNVINDQIITSGRDCVIKIWRVFPYSEHCLNPVMCLYCNYAPVHLTMMRDILCAAFQDYSTVNFSIVFHNLKNQERYDHDPKQDHFDDVTALTACDSLSLTASSSLDGTVRIWNETNTLVRLLKLGVVPSTICFSGTKGDLLVGIGSYLYLIHHSTYLPKLYKTNMMCMNFPDPLPDKPLTLDENELNKLPPKIRNHLKALSLFKLKTSEERTANEELKEISKKRGEKEEAHKVLETRENDLLQLQKSEIKVKKDMTYNKKIEDEAFQKYFKMFYNFPKTTLPLEDPYIDDTIEEQLRDHLPRIGSVFENTVLEGGYVKPSLKSVFQEEEKWRPDKVRGFFHLPARAIMKPIDPLQAPYQLNLNGFLPNSVLVKLIWPAEPKSSKEEIEENQQRHLQKIMSSIDEKRRKMELEAEGFYFEDYADSVLEGSDEERVEVEITTSQKKRTSPGEKRTSSGEKRTSPGEKRTSPGEKRTSLGEKRTSLGEDKEGKDKEEAKKKTVPVARKPEEAVKPTEDLDASKKVETPMKKEKPEEYKVEEPAAAELGEQKEIKAKTPPDYSGPVHLALTKPPSKPQSVAVVSPPHESTSTSFLYPSFVSKHLTADWFQACFPVFDETVFPKPWTVDAFGSLLLNKLAKVNPRHGSLILEALAELHTLKALSNVDAIARSIFELLEKYAGINMTAAKTFIIMALWCLYTLNVKTREFFAELFIQFNEGDREIRSTVMDILNSCGYVDPNLYLSQELDSWNVSSFDSVENLVQERQQLKNVCGNWLDKWMARFKFHIHDTLKKLKEGQKVHGRLSKDQLLSSRQRLASKSLEKMHVHGKESSVTYKLDSSTTDSATYIEAINYFCDMCYEKNLETLSRSQMGSAGVERSDSRNTILVLPKMKRRLVLPRLGEMDSRSCKAYRETQYFFDYSKPPITFENYQPFQQRQIELNQCLHLPMKKVHLNPFPSPADKFNPELQEPILITLKMSPKYFIHAQSYVLPAA